MIKLTNILNEITINKPTAPLSFKKDIDDEIIKQIIEEIESNASNESIIDFYISSDNKIEDIVTDYVKHEMLSDEDIDMDSEEINNLDRDAVIEYINNNKPLQLYLCNIFWKYYMNILNSKLSEIKKLCYEYLKAYPNKNISKTAIEWEVKGTLAHFIDILYPTYVISVDDEFSSYLYDKLTK